MKVSDNSDSGLLNHDHNNIVNTLRLKMNTSSIEVNINNGGNDDSSNNNNIDTTSHLNDKYRKMRTIDSEE